MYENSEDYAQKPQRNCTFMSLASAERGRGGYTPFKINTQRKRSLDSISQAYLPLVRLSLYVVYVPQAAKKFNY
jgi:hypothetical protein